MENPIFLLNTYWNVKFPVSSGSSSSTTCSSPSTMNYRLSNFQKSYYYKPPSLSVLWTNFYCRDEHWWGIWTPSAKHMFLCSYLLVHNWHVSAPIKSARLSPATKNFRGYFHDFQVNPVTEFDETMITYFQILYNSLCLNVPAIEAVQSDLQKKSWNKSQLLFQYLYVSLTMNSGMNCIRYSSSI